MTKSMRLPSASRTSSSGDRKLQLQQPRRFYCPWTAALCLYLRTWLPLLLLLRISIVDAQNADCRLEMWVYSSQSECESGGSPSARAYLYADETCRTNDIFSSTSSSYDDSFPGTYEARCIESNGRVEFYQSGCISSDCAPVTDNGNCERDFSIPSGFYSLVNPPRYPVVSPGARACGNLYGSQGELLVVFTIFGDCSACLESLQAPQPSPTAGPTEAPTNPFTPPPTFLRTTRPPTMSPTSEPTAEPIAEETQEPTQGETQEPPAPAPTLPPFRPPVGPTDTLPTMAPSRPPPSTDAPQPSILTDAPTSSSQPTTDTAEPTLITPPTPPQPSPIVGEGSDKNNGALIGGVVGGGVVVLLIPLLWCAVWYGQKRERTKLEDQSSSEKAAGGSNNHHVAGVRHGGHTHALTDAASPTSPALTNVENAEILVPSEREDDVSTLGTPLVGLGYIDEDEQTASVDFDYRSRRSVTEESRTGSVTLTSLGKSTLAAFELRGLSLFDNDDERSIDEAFVEEGNGFPASSLHDKDAIEGFDCQVPEGKLGIVLDSPNPGNAPVVHALRPDSILNGHVRVGDRIVAVDGVDVAHLNHIEVSALISRKSSMPRKLTFVRRRAKDGSPNNSEC